MLFKIIFIAVVLKYSSGQGPFIVPVLMETVNKFPEVIQKRFSFVNSGTLKKEYKLERYFKANWFDANIFCRDHGMQLATVDSDQELIDINDQIQKIQVIESYGVYNYNYDNIWISATDLAEEGHFTWFSTGQVVSYTAWAMGHPFRADPNYQFDEFGQPIPKEIYENAEDCVQIRGETRTWENANCTNLNYFLCERV